jgi:histidinol-phosphatase (PHP family)
MKTEIKANYHTHTFLCKHALGDSEDYVKRAILLGYHTIAITDHGPFPKPLQKKINSRRMSIEQYEEVYLDMLDRSVKKHNDEILVLKGVEIEYLPELEPFYPKFLKDLDFMILGQHYIKVENGHKSIYTELTKEDILLYARTVKAGIESGMFKIVAHPEIFCWNLKEDECDETCIEAANMIIDAAIENEVVLEINVNGVRNSFYQRKEFYQDGKINFPYPRREFWDIAQSKNAMIVINDDAHAPNRLMDDYTLKTHKFVKEGGITIIDRIKGLNA